MYVPEKSSHRFIKRNPRAVHHNALCGGDLQAFRGPSVGEGCYMCETRTTKCDVVVRSYRP